MKRPLLVILSLLAIATAVLIWSRADMQQAPRPLLIATLPPLHSLASGVMAGVEPPRLLLPAGANPHRYALRPSDAAALHSSRVVAWFGPAVETFLQRQLNTLPGETRLLTIAELPGLTLLQARRGGAWPEPGEGDQTHAGEATHGTIDGHLWLDPVNAAIIVDALAGTLAETDPANAARYRDNAARMKRQLAALDRELQTELAALRGVPYIVYHDAYRYFEARYGLTPVAAITASAESAPGARRLAEIRGLLRAGGIRCIFTEPQFKPVLAERVAEGSDVRIATLDPVGATLEAGETLYFELLRGLARSLKSCLAAN